MNGVLAEATKGAAAAIKISDNLATEPVPRFALSPLPAGSKSPE